MRQIKWCNSCNKKSMFQQHSTGWCGSVTFMGMLNQFGHCLTKKVDSPELTAYEQTFKGEL